MRLREVAKVALSHYDLKVQAFHTLLHLENTTFRVEGDRDRQFTLRINRPSHRTEAQVRSEVAWLSSIRRDTELAVPEPVPNAGGDMVTRAAAPGVPEERICVLFKWVEGSFYRERLSPVALERVGRFTARLHQHAIGFNPPPDFSRHNVEFGDGDEPGEIARLMVKGFEEGAAIIRPHDLATFTMARHHIQEKVDATGHGRGVFGLIHADLHHGNYLFHNTEVRAIDFDDCGWGHFLYDLAVTQWYLQARPRYEAMCQAHLAGYQSIRRLSEEQLALLPTFRAARTLLMGVYMAGRADNPKLHAQAPQFVAHCASALRDYLASERGATGGA
jgi:Ser/Thr protein kinase RdoA (MazF antagonist)